MDYLLCQRSALGHAWDGFEDPEFRGGVWKNVMHDRCMRCGTVRHTAIDFYGNIDHRRYEHPADYSYPPGLRPTAQEVRQKLYRKRTGKAVAKTPEKTKRAKKEAAA